MKKVLLVIVCCLCLCGCDKKGKITYYECKKSSIISDNVVNFINKFNCKNETILNHENIQELTFQSDEQAQYMYKLFSSDYENVSLNAKTITIITLESEQFIKDIGDCFDYLNHWKDKGWACTQDTQK